VPLATRSTAPVVKTSRKSCNNKALGESTFKSLVNHCHCHGSQPPLPVNVKQVLPQQYAVPFEALPPFSIMVGPTEASPLSCSLQAPVKVLANAIPVEAMAGLSTEELTTVPFEVLPSVKPIAVLAIGPRNPLSST
jgi:hypothetical protein